MRAGAAERPGTSRRRGSEPGAPARPPRRSPLLGPGRGGPPGGRQGRQRGFPERRHVVGAALGFGLGAQGDQVGQLGHRREVAGLGEPLEPERVQGVSARSRRSASIPENARGSR